MFAKIDRSFIEQVDITPGDVVRLTVRQRVDGHESDAECGAWPGEAPQVDPLTPSLTVNVPKLDAVRLMHAKLGHFGGMLWLVVSKRTSGTKPPVSQSLAIILNGPVEAAQALDTFLSAVYAGACDRQINFPPFRAAFLPTVFEDRPPIPQE